MSNPFTESYLLDTLVRGVPVVLPNHRAARAVRRAFDDRQRGDGLRVWDAAPVLAWSDWTHSLWSNLALDGHELRLLLNTEQERSLWREVIETSTAGRTLSSPDALEEMAASAFSLAAAHHGISRLRATATTYDSRAFAAWAEAFTRLTATQNCLPAALLEDALSDHVRSGALRLANPVLIAGFEEFTPAQSALLNALRSAGAEITAADLAPVVRSSGAFVSTVVATPREEIVFAARWLCKYFAGHHSDPSPPRVAVLLPQPQEGRAELESIFREVLAPELQPIGADNSSTPWEFVSGSPLLAQQMVVDALGLVHLAQGPQPIERISALLRSPFIGLSADRLVAARFDASVLRRGSYLVPELDLDGLRQVVRRQSRYMPAWLNRLNDVRVTIQRGAAARSYAEWTEVIRDLLRAANWPGDRTPTPSEFAAVRVWDSTLDMLATLDFRGRRVAFFAAVKALERLLRSAKVSAPAGNAPIQIMQPDQGEGSLFDAVILLHATDEAWPAPARLHPLLGWPLQQSLGLPGADASRDADRARTQAESLLARSSNFLALSAGKDERGMLRPSPLLKQLEVPSTAPDELLEGEQPRKAVTEEVVPDDVLLPPLPSSELHGGASVLKQQAACGFLAFAEMRLRAERLDLLELGLDAGERGNLVHHALEYFWTITRSQAELRSLARDERSHRLDGAIDHAFAKLSSPSAGWSSAYIAIQRERLRRLLSKWLEVELERGPFTVRSREERATIPIGPLELKVRPDRVDEVEDGIVLVDYKTGYHAHSSSWLGDRPDEPQLPLYSLLKPEHLRALLFGRIRPGDGMEWQGLTSDPEVLPRNKWQKIADLDLRRDDWRIVLTRLANEFAAGRAEADPKSFIVNCDGCAQRILCRIDASTLVTISPDEPENEEELDV